jgi:hypothetical protein
MSNRARIARLRSMVLVGQLPEPVVRASLRPPPPGTRVVRASQINPAFPVFGTPTTQSVRDNFAAARSEIEALQDGKLNLSGGTMTGPIVLTVTQIIDGGVF